MSTRVSTVRWHKRSMDLFMRISIRNSMDSSLDRYQHIWSGIKMDVNFYNEIIQKLNLPVQVVAQDGWFATVEFTVEVDDEQEVMDKLAGNPYPVCDALWSPIRVGDILLKGDDSAVVTKMGGIRDVYCNFNHITPMRVDDRVRIIFPTS